MSESVLDSAQPMPFCPGCGHTIILERIAAAVDALDIRPTDLCLVTDIGCVGLADKYFACHTFHGLHGRSVTYASGLKLANPELNVIVLIGDGGCGIGAGHLLHAARRQLDMTVLVFNNFNFGMTGGQHSPTTPAGYRTATTPAGTVEVPMNVCETVRVNGANFVARTTAYDRDLVETLQRAVRCRGFSLVDVWEMCTAYFMPMNDFRRKTMQEVSSQWSLPFGVLRDEPREIAPTAASPAPEPRQIAGRFEPLRRQRHTLQLVGDAGQKIKSAAVLTAQAGVTASLHASQKDDFPITILTGHSVSELILDPEPIEYTGVEGPDSILVLGAAGLARVRGLDHARDDTLILADEATSLPASKGRVVVAPFTALAKAIGATFVASVALGAWLAATPLIPKEAWLSAIDAFLKPALRKPSREAFLRGHNWMTERAETHS